jgi:hypothetical protein
VVIPRDSWPQLRAPTATRVAIAATRTRRRARSAEGEQARQLSHRKKKGFPVVLAGLGAVSAVAIVAVLATGSGQPAAPTGGLTITIPGP